MPTIPITTAIVKISFSKLKTINNYLCTTVVQERFSDLAIMSIENEIRENLDYNSNLTIKFSETKTKKINFI